MVTFRAQCEREKSPSGCCAETLRRRGEGIAKQGWPTGGRPLQLTGLLAGDSLDKQRARAVVANVLIRNILVE